MDKIMKALLEAKYPTLNADTLLEIASMTPNATLAVEKLCGIHEPYTVEQLGEYRESSGGTQYTLFSINEWETSVSYTYEEEDSKGYYVPKDIYDTSILTMDNIDQYKCAHGGNARWVIIKTGEIVTRRSSMSIPMWLELKEYALVP
jgi:hypothetical protein